MGYQRQDDRWLTAFEIRKVRDGQVWHDRFGWLPREHVARYEAGERHFAGGWRSAADDAKAARRHPQSLGRRHGALRRAHQPQPRGRRAAGRPTGAAVRDLGAGVPRLRRRPTSSLPGASRAAPARPPSRAGTRSFTSATATSTSVRSRKTSPISTSPAATIGATSGRRTSSPASEADDSNLYHEATHQLFSETRPVVRDIGREANFWIIEGVACYMESLHVARRLVVAGRGRRRAAARRPASAARRQVLRAAGRARGLWHASACSTTSGSPCSTARPSGLTHFLMHYDRGRYRDALVRVSGGDLHRPRPAGHAGRADRSQLSRTSTGSIASFCRACRNNDVAVRPHASPLAPANANRICRSLTP